MKTACFTGHRRIPSALHDGLFSRLLRAIEEAYANGYRCFLCGGALGFDTLAARAVLKAREKHPDLLLHLALPCGDQAARWNGEDRRAYEEIRKEADQTVVLSDRYYPGCMQTRNRYMVEHSSLCICYWKEARGGTAFTVRYAVYRGLDIVNLAMPEEVMREKTCCYTFISPSAGKNAATAPLRLSPGRKLKPKKTSG